MKTAGLAIAVFLAFATTEATALCGPLNCHYNKTCQQLRAAGHCAQAMAAGGTHARVSDLNRYGNMRRTNCGSAGKMRGTCQSN
jgi:hypothetical protein